MQITLRINDEDKIFTNDFVSGMVFRNALELNEKMRKSGNDISVETFDEMIGFVVNVFDTQFTIDEFYKGLRTKDLQPEIMRVFNEVLGDGGLETKSSVDAEGKSVV